MHERSLIAFLIPALVLMLLFIAAPLLSVFIQSLYTEPTQELRMIESCGPFGCEQVAMVDGAVSVAMRSEKPLGLFYGLGNYLDRNHLAFAEIAHAWKVSTGPGVFVQKLLNLPFYKALLFTLLYTCVVTPFVIVAGFLVALAVNRLPALLRAPTLCLSLLPMIVTPLVGSLVIYWMIDADGLLGSSLSIFMQQPELTIDSSPGLTWLTLMLYGIWHSAPFAFVVYYAGLQTVPREPLESAMVDGAGRLQQLRYVVMPHLAPLTWLIVLIQLMDNFRVFEPVIGLSADAHVTSLSYYIYEDLRGDNQRFHSAAATSVLMVLIICALIAPVLLRHWRAIRRQPV